MDSTWIKAYVTFETCVNLSFLFPALIAWWRRHQLLPPLRILALLTVFIPVMFGLSRLAIILWKYNLLVGHLCTIGEGILYLWYFRKIYSGTKYRRLFPALQIIFIIFALLDSFFFEGFNQLNSYTNGLESFLCIGLSLLYLDYYIHTSNENRITRDPIAIANAAIMIYMAGTISTYLVLNNFIQQNDAENTYRVFFINIIMLCLLTVAFSLSFLAKQKIKTTKKAKLQVY